VKVYVLFTLENVYLCFRSKTCPQCRERTATRRIYKLYFNFSNNDSLLEDNTSLLNKIENLNFQIKLKDDNINILTENNEKLKRQRTGLKQQVYKYESEISNKNSTIHELKEEIEIFKQQLDETNYNLTKNKKLEKDSELRSDLKQYHLDGSTYKIENKILKKNIKLLQDLIKLSKDYKEIKKKYINLLEHIVKRTYSNSLKVPSM